MDFDLFDWIKNSKIQLDAFNKNEVYMNLRYVSTLHK